MPFAAAAVGAGVTAGAGLIGGIMQKNAIDKGASAARDALHQGITTATNQLSRGRRPACRRTRRRRTCWA